MMKHSTCTWDLISALEPAFPAVCTTRATSIDSIHPNNQSRRKKIFRKKTNLSTKRVILPWSTYTEPRTKRGKLKT